MKTRNQRNQPATEADAINRSKVQIAQQDALASVPRLRQIGDMHCDAPNANDAGVDEAVDSGERREFVDDARQRRTESIGVRRHAKNLHRIPRQPNQNRRKEKEVEKAEPNSRGPINASDGGIGIAEGEQRSYNEAEGQNEHCDAQIARRYGRGAGAEGSDESGVNEPMRKEKGWPWMTRMAKTGQAFKSGSPFIHDCMRRVGLFRSGSIADARETISL